MKLEQLGEFGLIDLIRKKFSARSKNIFIGIGDDAAVIKTRPGTVSVLTTDALVESVHFDLNYFSFYQLGGRSLAASLSDLAAMGATPVCALVTLGINENVSVEDVLQFYSGFSHLAKRFNCPLAGGDISLSPERMVISVTVLGQVKKGKVFFRSGARPGDLICVSGTLGQSQAGLELLQRRMKHSRFSFPKNLAAKHLMPLPRLDVSLLLSKNVKVNSAIDISDGLTADLKHICDESKVGALIFADLIPVSSKAVRAAKLLKKSPLDFALYGGEEYELLFTLDPKDARKLFRKTGRKFSVIGQIESRKNGIWIASGNKKEKLSPRGYTHF
ncbi:MAG: thiamine-phosphate kinase [candidate division Zixibacteria bacterium]|nr:thiamine-phosphate kinase [candidate division Zixibacteria bacterium]